MQQLWRELNDVVDRAASIVQRGRRQRRCTSTTTASPARLEPAILVAIDNFAEYIETFGQLDKEDDPNNLLQAFVALARQGISVRRALR